MLNLLEGIKVVDYHKANAKEPRAWINSGTFQPLQNFSEIPYSEDAFIPVESWRELSFMEQCSLYRTNLEGVLDKNNHVGIVHLPESTIAPLMDLGVAFVQTAEDCQLLSQNSLYQKAVDRIGKYLSFFGSSKKSLAVHQISVNSVGLPTVTFNHATRRFIGLHLDSWDRLPVEKRHLSTNRICINLGLEDRFLLFVNLTLTDIFYLTQTKEPVVNSRSLNCEKVEQKLESRYFSNTSTLTNLCPIAIRHNFLAKHPGYPVIKVRVSPGEAYIAPTENMIHDGCTVGKQFFDVTLTIRGHIELPSQTLV